MTRLEWRNECLFLIEVSTNMVQNEQIEADVEQLMDLMKTRKQQLESLLEEKMKDFRLVCVLENVTFPIFFSSLIQSPFFSFQQVTGTTSDDHINIHDSKIQQELKYHVVDELLNEQVQEVNKIISRDDNNNNNQSII